MTNQIHTQEPWLQDANYVITQGHSMIAYCSTNEEDARRIVACVNRLAPFKTKDIEDLGCDLFADDRPRLDEAMQKVMTLTRERDEMLAALKECIRELHACQAVIHLHGGFDPEYVKGALAAIKKADALINKAEAANHA